MPVHPRVTGIAGADQRPSRAPRPKPKLVQNDKTSGCLGAGADRAVATSAVQRRAEVAPLLHRGLGHTVPRPVRSARGIRQLEVLDPQIDQVESLEDYRDGVVLVERPRHENPKLNVKHVLKTNGQACPETTH